MEKIIERKYNEKEIDFKKKLNGYVNPDIITGDPIEIIGGCKDSGMNPIRVNKYFLGEAFRRGRGKRVKGIVCKDAFSEDVDDPDSCEGCKFYGSEKGKVPIYEFIELKISKQKSKKSQ